MNKLIMIKYGELTTKKGNRKFFIKTLVDNINSRLRNYEFEIRNDYYRMFIYVKDSDFDEIFCLLKNVFGIHEIACVYEFKDSSLESISSNCLEVLKDIKFNTFKVVTNRSQKSYPISSMELSRKVGGYLLRNLKDISVDVHNPDVYMNIEIRSESVYIYTNSIKGLGGYPVGSLGRAMLMLSGGIDSVVAGYLTIKRGVKLDFIYFESLPHTSLEARNKVIELANVLSNYGCHGKLNVINFTKIQEAIYRNCNRDYLITLMRRQMYRIAERVSKKSKCDAIINGESIGQVASQTLTSIKCVNEVTNYPIIRPLSGFDKLEIINIAKKIGTYEISILPYEDCCTIFVPTHPVINPSINECIKEESKYDYEELLEAALDDILVVDIPFKKDSSEYL